MPATYLYLDHENLYRVKFSFVEKIISFGNMKLCPSGIQAIKTQRRIVDLNLAST